MKKVILIAGILVAFTMCFSTVKAALEGSRGFCESGDLLKSSGVVTGAKSDVMFFNTVYNTDFVVAGFGGMRDTGLGDITLAGVTGPVTEAYLYWNGPTNSLDPSANANVFVNGTPVTGTNIGFSDDNCWDYDNSQAYRADVTALVQATGNGVYALTGFAAGPDINSNGASLIVFFIDVDATNNRDAVVLDGNDSNIDNPYDAPGWNVTMSGIDYDAGMAYMQLHVADGQEYSDDALILNSLTLDPGPEIFQGNSIPSDNNGPLDNGNLWDIKTYDVTSFLTPGPNTLSLTTGVAGDCLGLIVAIVDLPAGVAPEQPVVILDIKPQSCPNPFNPKSKGKLPVAILGTEDFDVSTVDPATVLLEGVAPLRWKIRDVSRPVDPRYGECDCTPDGGDGYMDLTLKFDHQEILAAIEPVSEGDIIILTLTGETFDGSPIEGRDCVVIPPSLCIPALISPVEGAVMDNGREDGLDDVVWDFDWSDCPGATEYHLYVKLPSALNPLIDDQTITSSSYHYVSTGYIIDANRFGWTWKVGVKVDGMWHRWTETRTFDVEPVNTDPPPPPKLSGDMADGFSLGDNYPNPFNPETDISFSVPERTVASLVVYNMLGQKVKTLVNGDMVAGTHTVHWDGKDEAGNPAASGVYFYRLKTDTFDQTKRMVLMK